jgi:hypothetical protein
MSVSNLLLSILALDSYNRGFGRGMNGVTGNAIGDVTFISDSDSLAGSQAAGFYAVKYHDASSGDDVISYRGTTFREGPDKKDVINGWTLAAGYAAASQAQLAKQFYLDAAGDVISCSPQSDVMPTFRDADLHTPSSRRRPGSVQLAFEGTIDDRAEWKI